MSETRQMTPEGLSTPTTPSSPSNGDLLEATRSPSTLLPPHPAVISGLRAPSMSKLTCYLQAIHPQVLDKHQPVIK